MYIRGHNQTKSATEVKLGISKLVKTDVYPYSATFRLPSNLM